MRVRATVSFSGSRISMYEGEEREIVSGDILADLFNAGYIEKVTEENQSATAGIKNFGTSGETKKRDAGGKPKTGRRGKTKNGTPRASSPTGK